MNKLLLISTILLYSINAFSQTSRNEYISKYQLLAIEEMERSGIPASITMAQACLESADGNSKLAKKSNNHFGIKCKSSWTGKKVYYDDDAKNECFRKYRTVEESYIDHTDFLMNNPRYASLFKLGSTNYKGWAKGLKKAGYATAKTYDKRLIHIIEEYKLYRLDYKISFDEIAVFEQHKIGNSGVSNSLTINAFQTHEVGKVNRVKAVVAKKGDTYEMIAQEFGISEWALYKYNDQVRGYHPIENEVIYIQPKKRRAKKSNTVHHVGINETMHYISQMFGVKLKPLYRRNKMKFGEQPVPGQIIFLRKAKKG